MSLFRRFVDWLFDVDWLFFFGCVAAAFAVVAVVAGALFFGGRETCANKAEAMGREWRYELFGGCLVRTDSGAWVPLDNYRLTDEERGR